MFFGRRSTQAEYFDLPGRLDSETLAEFHELDRLNRCFLFAKPFEDLLPLLLGEDRCARLEILDVGAGTGLLGETLAASAQRRDWQWQFTSLDVNPLVANNSRSPRVVVGSALALPFPDASFDVVLASQMTHHLTDAEVATHLREAWRVTRGAIMISDLHRNIGFYSMLWLATWLLGASRAARVDSLISVKRGFHLDELRSLAALAGIPKAQVSLYYGARILLRAIK